MKAVVYTKFGAPDVLQLVDHPLPQRAAGEVLVKIICSSVNPVDYMIRNGRIPMAKAKKILGGDLAGVVESADADSKFTKGDRVFALSPDCSQRSKWGCYAEFATIKSSLLASIPDSMSFEEAAALPLVSLTAIQALKAARLKAGQRVLIHGGSGGVGSVAVQIAKAQGVHVTSTCSAKNMQLVKTLGADEVIDYNQQPVDQLFRNNPFDAVLDVVGGATTIQSLAVLKRGGHLSMVSFNNPHYFRLISALFRGMLGLGPKVHVVVCSPDGRCMQEVGRLVTAGQLKAIVDQTFPLERAAAAHQYAEFGHPVGKVVLTITA